LTLLIHHETTFFSAFSLFQIYILILCSQYKFKKEKNECFAWVRAIGDGITDAGFLA